MATTAMMNETPDTRAARKEPMIPAPSARRNAINITPHAMGWRIITRVRALVVSSLAVLKSVDSIWDMMAAGL